MIMTRSQTTILKRLILGSRKKIIILDYKLDKLEKQDRLDSLYSLDNLDRPDRLDRLERLDSQE